MRIKTSFFVALLVLTVPPNLQAQQVRTQFQYINETESATTGEEHLNSKDITADSSTTVVAFSKEADLGANGVQLTAFLKIMFKNSSFMFRKKDEGDVSSARFVGHDVITNSSVLRVNWNSTGRVDNKDRFAGEGASYFVLSAASVTEVAAFRVSSNPFSDTQLSAVNLNDYLDDRGLYVTFFGRFSEKGSSRQVLNANFVTLGFTPKTKVLDLQTSLAVFDYGVNLHLSDSNVNLRDQPSLRANVLKVLTGDENLGTANCVLVPDVVAGKNGFWTRVTVENSEKGWVWSEYIAKIAPWYILPPAQYTAHFSGDAKGYQRQDLQAFLDSIEKKDLEATKRVLEKGFNFGLYIDIPKISEGNLWEDGDAISPRVYFLGLTGNDSTYISRFLTLLLQFKGNLTRFDTDPDFGGKLSGLYSGANPLSFAIRTRNFAAIDGILSAAPDILTMKVSTQVGRLYPPAIIAAILRDDVEMTGYLMNKGFPPNWVYDKIGEYSMGRAGIYSNLLSWAKSDKMKTFLQGRGVPQSITFPRPFTVTIPAGKVLSLNADRESTITTKTQIRTSVFGSLAQAILISESTNDFPNYTRKLLIMYENKEYLVDMRDVDYGGLFDH